MSLIPITYINSEWFMKRLGHFLVVVIESEEEPTKLYELIDQLVDDPFIFYKSISPSQESRVITNLYMSRKYWWSYYKFVLSGHIREEETEEDVVRWIETDIEFMYDLHWINIEDMEKWIESKKSSDGTKLI